MPPKCARLLQVRGPSVEASRGNQFCVTNVMVGRLKCQLTACQTRAQTIPKVGRDCNLFPACEIRGASVDRFSLPCGCDVNHIAIGQ